ncbi:hypothetical protein V8G54_018165 [Vigna mungo]|uniref:Uncharacterized protein n=1 Tax=Vigna mungo TaxID=3915 RepID=A0AAQ3RUB2_VIGMU
MALREAGFTEQRKPPTPDSGGITGCCHSWPCMPTSSVNVVTTPSNASSVYNFPVKISSNSISFQMQLFQCICQEKMERIKKSCSLTAPTLQDHYQIHLNELLVKKGH